MSSFFSLVQDAVKHELKTRAGEVQTKLKEQVEKAVLRVEESSYYKQHVEFNEANYFQLEDEVFGEENEVVEEEEQLRFKDPVGRLVISMLSCCKLAVGKAPGKPVQVEVQVEHISQRTRANAQYAWTNDVFEFPVYDLKSTLHIKVLMEGGLAKQDVLLGQVLIPVETLLPPFSLHQAEQPAAVVEQNKPKVYTLFPLDADKIEFECKAMTKPKQELGYLRCCTKLELVVPTVFAAYAKSPQFHSPQEEQSQHTRKIPSTIRTAKTLQKLAQLQQRFATIAVKLVFGPFALTVPFLRARECTNIVYTSTFVLAVCMVVLFAEAHLFPMFLWALIMLGGYMSCSSSPAAAAAAADQLQVWNEKDADALNPLQQVTLLLWVTERMVMVLGLIADGIERTINALEFKDVRASLVVLGGGGLLVSLGTSLLAYCIPWRIVVCLAFLTWTFSSVDYVELVQSLRTRVLRFVSPKQRNKRRSETSRWFAFTNYMAKIPTSQHLAHLQICQKQHLDEEEIQAKDLQFPD